MSVLVFQQSKIHVTKKKLIDRCFIVATECVASAFGGKLAISEKVVNGKNTCFLTHRCTSTLDPEFSDLGIDPMVQRFLCLLLGLLALPVVATELCGGVKQVDEGVFLCPGQPGAVFETRRVANTGFIVGQRCIAVIDTGGSPDEGRELLEAIRTVSSKPVCYVINTHVHPDHILGNSAFEGTNARFIGHHNLTRAMALLGPTYLRRAAQASGQDTAHWLQPPDQRVSEPIEIDLGERRLQLTPHAQAHTDNDLSVFDEQTGTLWAADLVFAGHIPVLGGSGSVLGWLQLLGKLGDFAAKKVVPGHGPVVVDSSHVIKAQQRYLTVLRDETRAWIADDGDISSALEHIGGLERGKWALFDQYHKRNVSYTYTELEWEN